MRRLALAVLALLAGLALWAVSPTARLPAAEAAVARAASAPSPAQVAAPPADHHLHVWSADAVEAIGRLQEALGEQVIPPEQQRVLGGADAVAQLDSAGIRRGVLLSNAYFFGIPDVEFEDERELVRAENDYVARQVREHPERLVGFGSVSPLADYALEEIERIAGVEELSGLKLHLANSDVDLRKEAHVEAVRAAFAKAEALDLPIVIHLYTRHEGYGAREARVFLERILPAAPTVPVQVAHLGGGGTYRPSTAEVVRVFAKAFREDPEATANVVFDLSGTPVPEALAKGDSALLARVKKINAGVVDAVGKLGPDRVVYGTDWPVIPVATYSSGLQTSLPMEDAEIRDLMDDEAPYLR